MTLQELMRCDLDLINEADLAEGPLRKIGMAATVAAGLMGSHASAQTSPQPSLIQPEAQPTLTPVTPAAQTAPQRPTSRVAQPQPDNANNLFFRAEIERKVGSLRQYLAKAKVAGTTKPDAQLTDDWLKQAAYSTGITPQQMEHYLASFDQESDVSSLLGAKASPPR
jgi:hypothetical protein